MRSQTSSALQSDGDDPDPDPGRGDEAANVVVDVHVHERSTRPALHSIRNGLLGTPRTISPEFFYDDEGSHLFECITELPEYYQTRTERCLLEEIAADIVERSQVEELVELGSGSSSKTRVLLDAMAGAQQLRQYVPFDVSEGIVRRAAHQLARQYRGLRVHGVVGEFATHLAQIPRHGKRLIIFLGSTIGNFEPPHDAQFLARVSDHMAPGEFFLLGTDLIKDPSRLEAAYNDSAHVTAAFNRNILHVINDVADADFDPNAFEHLAFYDHQLHRIEMWLVAQRRMSPELKALGLRILFEPGHRIRTEISVKYDRPMVEGLVQAAGLEVVRWYTDPQQLFALTLARRPLGQAT